MTQGLHILATGRALPARAVSNEELSRMVDTDSAWISSRSGIDQRYFCEEETAGDLAERAARQAMERAGIEPGDLCACIVATMTPDSLAPSQACLLQKRLGLTEDIPCFDLNAGCTGFAYGLSVARGMLLQSERRAVLLVGCEQLSRILDFTDRTTCVLFGDGAGAAVVGLREGPHACTLGARGDEQAIHVGGPGPERSFVAMEGQAVFRFAVEAIPRCVNSLLEQAGLAAEQIDWIVPHQANSRIIESAARRLHLPTKRFYQNMSRYGNTSAASIPIALDEMNERGLLKRGQKVICVGFGAGLTWGGLLLEW